jgi:hypothetical protein
MTPITMPAMEPIPQSQMTEATNDAIASAFVDWTGAPYPPYPVGAP